jgi:hypothetical protein
VAPGRGITREHGFGMISYQNLGDNSFSSGLLKGERITSITISKREILRGIMLQNLPSYPSTALCWCKKSQSGSDDLLRD